MKKSNVGRSSKTPYKHWLLDKELGRQTGIYANDAIRRKIPTDYNQPLLVIDMCAGDGAISEFSEVSSPSIICKHVAFARGKLKAVMIEKNEYSFISLLANIPDDVYDNVTVMNADAADFAPETTANQGVFINCDPNSVNEIPLNNDFINSLPRFSTMVVTLGCNVSGLKRLSKDKREGWFDYVNMVTESIPSYHDCLICSITMDSAQWAYLVRLPRAWSEGSKRMYINAGRKMFKHGVTVFSFNDERDEFTDQIKRLFLTKKEYASENS